MKKLGKIFANILIVAYAVVAIAVTILLLSYNEYHCSVLGGYTFILVTDDELEPDFEEGSLVIVKQTSAKKINEGDNIFLYRRISTSEFEIKYAEVLVKDTSKGERNVQYVLEGSTSVDHDDVIGSTEDMKVIPHMGTILSILESRYGYLFLIVVVSFIAFLYEIYELVMEIKYGDREEDEEDYDDEDYDDEEYDDEEYDDEYYEEEEEVVVKPRRTTTTRKKTTATAATQRKTTAAPKKTTTAKRTTTATKTATTKKTTATSAKAAAPKKTTTTRATTPKKATTSTTTTRKRTTTNK